MHTHAIYGRHGFDYLVVAFVLNASANAFLKVAADHGIIISGMSLSGLVAGIYFYRRTFLLH